MPNWKELLDEMQAAGGVIDVIRRKYLQQLHELTGRNVIIYYSGWLQRGESAPPSTFVLNDSDKNGFMATIHKLDRTKGLDLLLHTPGGDIAATESLVDYLRLMFGKDIRAIVPQLAMSAGTMLALSCKEIVMGKHSSLGPIDPQIGGLPAHGIIEEFDKAKEEIAKNPIAAAVWQPIIARYSPTLIGQCVKAIAWSNDVVNVWLQTGMFEGDPDAAAKADRIVSELGSHELMKSHARHVSAAKALELGINVRMLESDPDLQELVLTLHHAIIQTFASTASLKVIENHLGVAHIVTGEVVSAA